MNGSPAAPPSFRDIPEPIREELWGAERLEQRAAELAGAQRVRRGRQGDPRLTPRVARNGRFLLAAYRRVAESIHEERAITPAAEWLVDNFHVVEDQLREIREDLPASFARQLPKLADGPWRGYPRVYALALDFVAHTDSRFDADALRRFLAAYQRIQALTMGELWAVAITLRVVLVENLRRLTERLVRMRVVRDQAEELADTLLDGRPPGDAAAVLRRHEAAPLEVAFAVALLGRLRDQDPQATPALAWLDRRLADQGTTADEIVALEHQRQTAMNTSVRNVITSMRQISVFDWAAFFEDVSLVDAELAAHPPYREMEFATRDRYRHAVETLARGTGLTETAVARRALEAARTGADERRRDPGYHLIGGGRLAFERALRYRVPPRLWARRAFVRWASPCYLLTILAGTAALLAIALARQAGRPGLPWWGLAVLGLLALLPASELAIQLVNAWVMERLGPRVLPRLELEDGVPHWLRTLVAMPVLLTRIPDVEEQVGRLEVHYLANLEDELRFALLSDWTDAPAESMPEDEELLAAARAGIARLNALHGPAPDGEARFLLLHRRRVWSAGEGCWLGWERKRGKLEELNNLLRGSGDTTFLPVGDPTAAAPFDGGAIRYVITLDNDTRLPRDAARRLIGTLAHPLNQARYDAGKGRVVEGYGILQPRVTPTLPAEGEWTLYQVVFSGPAGVDPYAAAVSDVYQDLFDEGSFTGKGIYDVDAFRAALAGQVPEETVLSHDLFEGVFARAGLVTDVVLFEEFPAHFDTASVRRHRWARGDWQLLPWIVGRGPRGEGGRRRVRIPAIGRFKMLDNLRRTLLAPASYLLLVAAALVPGASPRLWTLFWLATLAVPAFLPLLYAAVPRRRGIAKRSHLRVVAGELGLAAARLALRITFLADEAWWMVDALVRSLVRLYVTHRRRLEWVTAAQAKRGRRLDLGAFLRRMTGSLVLAAAPAAALAVAAGVGGMAGGGGVGGGGAVWQAPGAAAAGWLWLAPLLVLWAAAPAVARWVSLPRTPPAAAPLPAEDALALRRIARFVWRFADTFVTAEEHWLPPDNYQEDPRPVVAHRTSPTNIGLYLLAVTAAHDLGWIGLVECVERLEATLGTIGGMARFHGHLFNWYDTLTLAPLEPRYVSTVDSGNLAGHLVALAEVCRRLAERPLYGEQALAGIADAVRLTREAAPSSAGRRTETATRRHLDGALDALEARLAAGAPADAGAWKVLLDAVAAGFAEVVDVAQALAGEQSTDVEAAAWRETLAWAQMGQRTVESHRRDAAGLLAAAVSGSAAGAAAAGAPADGGAPSLRELWERLGEQDAAAGSLGRRLAELERTATRVFQQMDFRFLYDSGRKLFAIGYRMQDNALDPNYYDLLASEARLASFIAIAKGDVPAEHWFKLGRPLTPVARGAVLISWSGSMFEYLMPELVMRAPAHSLLDQTCRLVVRRQIQYGRERGVPWGISESAFNARDMELTYQYSTFGVPGLGLKRGLSEDLVVAPYATALGAICEPLAARRNFSRLARLGARGPFGFYEAVDFSPSRLRQGETHAVVRTYMAHHQGMLLLALAEVLDAWRDGALPARFQAAPLVQATELLLQERTPRAVAVARPRAEEVQAAPQIAALQPPVERRYEGPHSALPRTQLLSNGRYAVMLTAAGSGYSRLHDLAVTRYREDGTRDDWGTYLFLREMQSGMVWSAGYQPSGVEPDSYTVLFSEDRVQIERRDDAVTCRLEVVVSPEDDAEVRRLTLVHGGTRPREIEVTSYAELVLAPPAADVAHPAYSNLFVETEHVPALGALLAWRRPRASTDARLWAAHVLAADGETVGAVQYETDRLRFLGRGRGVRTPMSVVDGRPLSNTTGAVLDPIFSLRRRVRLQPGGAARLTFTTLVAGSREAALALADKYRDPAVFERASTMAWTQAQVELRHLATPPDEANLFQRLAAALLFADTALRAPAEALQRPTAGAAALWALGISGDLPILVLRIDAVDDAPVAQQLVKAHEYYRAKRLAVDLVFLNEKPVSYNQDLQGALDALLRAAQARHHDEGKPPQGGVFVLRGDQLSAESRAALLAAARVVLQARNGTLGEQIGRRERSTETAPPPPRRTPTGRRQAAARPPGEAPPARPDLELWNGLGGFTDGGREYVIVLGEGQWTPAPWCNVVANPDFGFQVSESGAGYTWAGNSRENQLTPWSNDPVSDPPGEALYVRDEESGTLWGPTLLPIREEAWLYVVRHGQGWSRFAHDSHGIALELLVFVPRADPVKVSRLTIVNHDTRTRRLSVTAYVEWVLGSARSEIARHVVSELDEATGTLLARRTWGGDMPTGRVAFAALGAPPAAWTADRGELLGRHGTLDHPAALEDRGHRLSGRAGAGLDPCAALQAPVELRAGARVDVLFLLGEAADREEALRLVRRWRAADVDGELAAVHAQWEDIAGALQVKTPDRSLDLMVNRWLIYQTLSCRLWARTAFYQAGGAYGFRDQLQDVLALVVARRDLTRQHLLLAAGRQFRQGDVQHWWHPPSGKGVRTRISDDLLWLPYAVLHYMEVTGDRAVLDEEIPFLEGPAVADGEDDAYFAPTVSAEHGTLFEHCARAVDARLAAGAHGLPLMGTGDWNDGMNRVGREGRGESVWLGWFLHILLWEMAAIAERRGETARAEAWRGRRAALKTALEDAWDGDWYRRAYFDDGSPLGSSGNPECRIDSIAQSWAVISGAAEPARAARAMAAVEEYLVRRGDGLVLLFTPPFDRSALDPGYIKGYLPGVRENGGQYTHGAIWCVLAFAALGEGDRAGELFSILNPINHASNRAGIQRYKVEPYVAAGDIYAEASHVGRGGWTWYTGSAGWMYRGGVEWILGFRLRGTTLSIDPCIPRAWTGYQITFRYHSARYLLVVDNPRRAARGLTAAQLDGKPIPLSPQGTADVALDMEGDHEIRAVLG